MKIDRVQAVIVDAGRWKNWVFARIDTADGITGWGEAFTEGGGSVRSPPRSRHSVCAWSVATHSPSGP